MNSKRSVSFESLYRRLAEGKTKKRRTTLEIALDVLTQAGREMTYGEVEAAAGVKFNTKTMDTLRARGLVAVRPDPRHPSRLLYRVKEPLARVRDTAGPAGPQTLRKTNKKTGGLK